METLRMQAFDKSTEIISAFFTNRYYNDIYSIAKDYFAKNGGKSLTEVYANLLSAYLYDINNAKPSNDSVIRDTIKALHAYYCSYMGEVALDNFISRIISQIVPDEFNSTMGVREKDSILRDIVKQTAIAVGKRAISADMLHRIIDKRSDQVGVGVLRDIGITVLRDFRASLISKLYGSDGSSKSGGTLSTRMITAELYDKVRNELEKVLGMLVQTEADYKKLQQENAKLKRHCAKLQKEIGALSVVRATVAPVPAPPVALVPVTPAPEFPIGYDSGLSGGAQAQISTMIREPAPKTVDEIRARLLEIPTCAGAACAGAGADAVGISTAGDDAGADVVIAPDVSINPVILDDSDVSDAEFDISAATAEIVLKNREKQMQ